MIYSVIALYTVQLHTSTHVARSAVGSHSCGPVCNDVSAAWGKTAKVRLQHALGVRTVPVTAVTVLLTLIDHMTEATAARTKERDTEGDRKT